MSTTRNPRRGLRVGLAGLLMALELATAFAPGMARAQSASSFTDYPVPGGWFYSQESRMPDSQPPFRGYTVVDDGEAAFWTGFRRFGALDVLGYPVSRRYRYPDANGDLYQAFQRGVLKWRPDLGEAELANIFDQFTEQGLDDQLEIVGIPRPRPRTDLEFADDAERRMSWLSEPRFLARYFFDPVYQAPFPAQEAAWDFFGLPQSFAERPVYFREKANGKYGAPLYLWYVAQRFQKGGLQLFLDNLPLDPTIVPGDGRQGCLSMTAVGRLARRLGAGKIIPSVATMPEPTENPPRVHFVTYVPPTTGPNQSTIQFEMVGTGFDPSEPVTIKLTALPTGSAAVAPYPVVVSHVDKVDPDGSFDQLITARVTSYSASVIGDTSGKTVDSGQDPTINLAVPSVDPAAATAKSAFC